MKLYWRYKKDGKWTWAPALRVHSKTGKLYTTVYNNLISPECLEGEE